jgi:hypothetical protein
LTEAAGLATDTAYLKACAMLGVNPNTGERWSDDDEGNQLKEQLEKWKRLSDIWAERHSTGLRMSEGGD